MPIPADAAIIARDPLLPGLEVALDAAALGEVVARHWPECEGDLQPMYLRYKPEASCISGFRLGQGEGVVHGYLRATTAERYRERRAAPDAGAEAGTGGQGGISLPELCAELYRAEQDPELSGARRLLAPESRAEVLSRFVRKRPHLLEAPVRILRYKPERRLVAHVGGDDGLIIKCYTEQGFAHAAAHAGDVARTKALHFPRLRGASVSRAMLAWKWVPGVPLSEHLARGDDQREAIARVGAALTSLHGQSPPLSARYQPCMVASDAAIVAADLAFVLPELAGEAAALATELTAALAAVDPVPAALHGDFSAEQVIIEPGGRVSLIDFDRAAAGHPAYDLGMFAARLALDGHARAAEITEELQRAYREASGCDLGPVLPAFVAAALLLLSMEPFRRRRADWPSATAAILARASELLRDARTPA